VFPTLTLLAIIVTAFLGIYTLNTFMLAMMAARKILGHKAVDAEDPALSSLPPITIQIPVYNEGPLIESVLENVAKLDYPRDKMEIQILDDSTDLETLEKEQEFTEICQRDGYDIQLIHRDSRSGYKAGALNNGLKLAKGDYVVIVDADTVTPTGFLKELIPYFSVDEDLGFVQVRCGYTDRWFNWITVSNAMERDVHYLVEQPAKNWYNLLPNFGGKAGMWRRSVLREYWWDEKILTEDIELSYRVQSDGWRGIYLHVPTCLIELPPSLTALKTQQRRWTAGFAQSLRKLWRPLVKSRRLTLSQKLETLIFLSTPITHLAALSAIFLWVLAAILEPEATLSLWLTNPAFSIFLTLVSMSPNISVIVGILRNGEQKKRQLLSIPVMLTVATANLITNATGALEGFLKDDLVFHRTIKYGITQDNGTQRLDNSAPHKMSHNGLELAGALLTIAAATKLLLMGQATSAIILTYISFSWLISFFQK
jgi:cellulose synthase/poly-beta-1,6-N-acetylglucosamine synthase-like glycosyltransferase